MSEVIRQKLRELNEGKTIRELNDPNMANYCLVCYDIPTDKNGYVYPETYNELQKLFHSKGGFMVQKSIWAIERKYINEIKTLFAESPLAKLFFHEPLTEEDWNSMFQMYVKKQVEKYNKLYAEVCLLPITPEEEKEAEIGRIVTKLFRLDRELLFKPVFNKISDTRSKILQLISNHMVEEEEDDEA